MSEEAVTNFDFAKHVRSASFCLTLSTQMIEALLSVAAEQGRVGYGMVHHGRTATAIYSRGLIVPTCQKVPEDWMQSPSWPYCFELTRAGRLTVGLLKEAGYRSQFLEWLDEFDADDGVETKYDIEVSRKNPSEKEES